MSDTPSTPTTSKSRIFMSRLLSTVFLWTVIGTGLYLKLDWILLSMMAIAGLLGTWEYFRLQHRDDPQSGVFTKGALALAAFYWAALFYFCVKGDVEPPWWLDALVIWLAVVGSFTLVFLRPLEGDATLRRLFNGVFGIVYTTILWGFMVKLLFFHDQTTGAYLVLLVILVTKFGDMGAYALGSLIGKNKMVPHISPGKSWEGFVGALLCSFAGMAIMMSLIPHLLHPLTWGHAIVLAPILCVLGVMGDLAESVLKRCHQIKDSGSKLPGIGGVLDLTDSLIFTAPAAYFYLRAIS